MEIIHYLFLIALFIKVRKKNYVGVGVITFPSYDLRKWANLYKKKKTSIKKHHISIKTYFKALKNKENIYKNIRIIINQRSTK